MRRAKATPKSYVQAMRNHLRARGLRVPRSLRDARQPRSGRPASKRTASRPVTTARAGTPSTSRDGPPDDGPPVGRAPAPADPPRPHASHVCARTRVVAVGNDGSRAEVPPGADPLVDAIRSGRALLQIVSAAPGEALPAGCPVPMQIDHRVVTHFRARSSNGAECIVALVLPADRLRKPTLTDADRDRIAAALADELLKGIKP